MARIKTDDLTGVSDLSDAEKKSVIGGTNSTTSWDGDDANPFAWDAEDKNPFARDGDGDGREQNIEDGVIDRGS